MRAFPNQLAVGILLIVVSIATAAPAIAQPVYTVEPPADVRDLLARVVTVHESGWMSAACAVNVWPAWRHRFLFLLSVWPLCRPMSWP